MYRARRLRRNPAIRAMVREHQLTVDDLILPLFIEEGEGIVKEISSMPGIFRFSIDQLEAELKEIRQIGIRSLMLFGIPKSKDAVGSSSWEQEGIVQQAIRYIKKEYPEFYLMADSCFCEYTDHGHCGVVKGEDVDNDLTLGNLQKQAISMAKAGVDLIAPSGMMDGMVAAIREALDGNGYEMTPIMSYAVKYASAFYGPFRDAADSTPAFGDRKTYQMDPANRREAIKEAQQDIKEGADLLMVKPALSYLDIIRDIKELSNLPLAAYNVSGEYAMVKAAAAKGWIDGDKVVLEKLLSMKRAGADLILTYHAKEIAKLL